MASENKDNKSEVIVSQSDIDSLFDSVDSSSVSKPENDLIQAVKSSQSFQISQDDIDSLFNAPDTFLDSGDKSQEVSAGNDDDFSGVSQNAIDNLIANEGRDEDSSVSSDFEMNGDLDDISSVDIDSIISAVSEDDENFDESEISTDEELGEIISQDDIDGLFDSSFSSESDQPEQSDKENSNKETDKNVFESKDDWALSQDEINKLLEKGPEDSGQEAEEETPLDEEVNEVLIDFETSKGSNQLSQDFLDSIEAQFLNSQKKDDEDVNIEEILGDFSEDDDLYDEDIDALLDNADSEDELTGDGNDIDFISQDDIDELIGTSPEKDSFEEEASSESESSENQPTADLDEDGRLSQEELDNLFVDSDDSSEEDGGAADLYEEGVEDSKTVILEEPGEVDEKPGKTKKYLVLSSVAACLVLIISSVSFFIYMKIVKKPESHKVVVNIPDKEIDSKLFMDINKTPKTKTPVVSTISMEGFIIPSPLKFKKYSYLEADLSIDIKGEDLYTIFNKNDSFFRDIIFKIISSEFTKITGGKEGDLVREDIEKIILKEIGAILKTKGAVSHVVFTKFEPV